MDGPEEESTSGASTTDSAHRGLVAPPLRSDSSVHRQLSNQLRELEDENKKLAIICCCCCINHYIGSGSGCIASELQVILNLMNQH